MTNSNQSYPFDAIGICPPKGNIGQQRTKWQYIESATKTATKKSRSATERTSNFYAYARSYEVGLPSFQMLIVTLAAIWTVALCFAVYL